MSTGNDLSRWWQWLLFPAYFLESNSAKYKDYLCVWLYICIEPFSAFCDVPIQKLHLCMQIIHALINDNHLFFFYVEDHSGCMLSVLSHCLDQYRWRGKKLNMLSPFVNWHHSASDRCTYTQENTNKSKYFWCTRGVKCFHIHSKSLCRQFKAPVQPWTHSFF